MNFVPDKYLAIDFGTAMRRNAAAIIGSGVKVDNKPSMVVGNANAGTNNGGLIAVVPMIGELYMYSYGGWYVGYQETEKILNSLAADDSISGVVLRINTPGGGVAGIARLANVINQFPKKIEAFVEQSCTSGGMYLASQCDSITVAEDNACVLGSIGVLAMMADYSKNLEQAGIRIVIQRAKGAGNKAKPNAYEGFTDEDLADEQKVLDAMMVEFKSVMLAGRPNIATQVWADEAKVYTGGQAIKLGLADRIGGIEKAIGLAAEAGKRKKKKMLNVNKNYMSDFKTPALARLAGAENIVVEELNDTDAYRSVSEANLVAIETAVIALEGNLATANETLANEQAAHAATVALLYAEKAVNVSNQAVAAELATKTARVAELEKFFANQKNAGIEAGLDAGDAGIGKGEGKKLSTSEKFPSLSKELGLR